MSHMIEDNMIAWKGEEPWHGLGYKVPDNATGEEMLNIAKLNWKVQRRSIAMRPSNGDTKTMLTEPLDGFRAIVRADNDHVFQVASSRFRPVQNAQIVDFFKRYCEAGHATMETVGGLKGGAIVWALARLNGTTDTSLGTDGKDEVRGYMLLATGHDGSLQTIGRPTQTRVVCWNTLSAAIGLSGGKLDKKDAREFRRKHTAEWSASIAAEAQKVMGMAIEQIHATNELAAALTKVKVDGKGKIEFLRKLLSLDKEPVPTGDVVEPTPDEVDRVLASYEASVSEADVAGLGRVGQNILTAIYTSPGAKLTTADGTLWGAVNGATFYADHMRGRSQDSRLTTAWFGAGDDLKSKAVEVAVEMAGIR